MENKINVLNEGYVRLVDVLGSDLSVVNSARVSYDKASTELTTQDERLIKFLTREGHTSPFRHATLQFEVYAPLMIARQWWKYVVGSSWQDPMVAWNESSRRYITEQETFYVPNANEWRSKPANSKQGSGAVLPEEQGQVLTENLLKYIEEGERLYKTAMENGNIAPEQARLFLPAYALNCRFYWTASLQGVAHLLNQRLKSDSQHEFQLYAQAVKELADQHFPVSLEELVKETV